MQIRPGIFPAEAARPLHRGKATDPRQQHDFPFWAWRGRPGGILRRFGRSWRLLIAHSLRGGCDEAKGNGLQFHQPVAG